MTETDPLRYSILASGSTGNVTYLETRNHRILIDAGLSGKRIENLMKKIDRSLKDVDAIFVTHEHSDHTHGVGVLARRYGMGGILWDTVYSPQQEPGSGSELYRACEM